MTFVPNPKVYRPCGPSRPSNYVAYKSSGRTYPCLPFLDIEQLNAPQHEISREDETTGLPKKLSRKEQQAKNEADLIKKKRKAKSQTGKRTDGKPNLSEVMV